jgi:hypothetical protein
MDRDALARKRFSKIFLGAYGAGEHNRQQQDSRSATHPCGKRAKLGKSQGLKGQRTKKAILGGGSRRGTQRFRWSWPGGCSTGKPSGRRGERRRRAVVSRPSPAIKKPPKDHETLAPQPRRHGRACQITSTAGWEGSTQRACNQLQVIWTAHTSFAQTESPGIATFGRKA